MHLKGDILTQIINYFKDIPLLDSHRNLAIKNTMNTLHFVSYLGDPNDLSQLKKLKIMRKLQTKNTDQFLNCQFWMVTDPKIADRLKISTQEKGILHIYISCRYRKFVLNQRSEQWTSESRAHHNMWK